MKTVNYCRKMNKNHEINVKIHRKNVFQKILKMQWKWVFCKIEIQEGYRSQKNILNTFLKRSLHDLSILFIGKMIWLLKHWFKVTKQKSIKHVFSCFLKCLFFIKFIIIVMIFDHCFAIFYYFHHYFVIWSKYFVTWGKYISCFGVFAHGRMGIEGWSLNLMGTIAGRG